MIAFLYYNKGKLNGTNSYVNTLQHFFQGTIDFIEIVSDPLPNKLIFEIASAIATVEYYPEIKERLEKANKIITEDLGIGHVLQSFGHDVYALSRIRFDFPDETARILRPLGEGLKFIAHTEKSKQDILNFFPNSEIVILPPIFPPNMQLNTTETIYASGRDIPSKNLKTAERLFSNLSTNIKSRIYIVTDKENLPSIYSVNKDLKKEEFVRKSKYMLLTSLSEAGCLTIQEAIMKGQQIIALEECRYWIEDSWLPSITFIKTTLGEAIIEASNKPINFNQRILIHYEEPLKAWYNFIEGE